MSLPSREGTRNWREYREERLSTVETAYVNGDLLTRSEAAADPEVVAMVVKGLGRPKYESPEKCKHGRSEMHTHPDWACAGPISTLVGWFIPVEGEEG